MPETITVRGENITIDLLLWRKYGVRGRSLLERTYELNQDLALLGPVLPLGTVVTLPDLAAETGEARQVVSLFG